MLWRHIKVGYHIFHVHPYYQVLPYLNDTNYSIIIYNSLVVSTIVTVAILGLPRLTLLGSELFIIVSVKDSSPSCIVSLIIGTSNIALVTPAVNVTLYSPEL